ncbi:MAG TPA: ABC transporter permease, partial [Oceanospirillaceae bacterium]|nr:ABC transporter permease [Oceanospirillaceae bacterium]
MTTANPSIDQANTLPLKEKLAKTTAIQRRRAFLLTLPLVLFLLISFVFPIGQMLFNSIHNNKVSAVVPDFATAIQQWDGQGLPSEETFEIFVKDLAKAKKVREVGRTVGNMATRINYEMPGSRSLFTKSARKVKNIKQGPYKEALIKIDKKWANPQVWLTLQRASHDISPSFYVAAMDLKYDETGEIVQADELYQIYL